MGYRYDIRQLTPQQQAIINQRDLNNSLHNKSVSSTKSKEIYPLKIFMKLGLDSTTQFNGTKILDTYKKFLDSKGSVWFSTDSLATGMAESKRADFINAINKEKVVEMYFAVSKTNDGANKIIAVAEVLDIKTDKDGIVTPDSLLTPKEWINDKNKIWIKLHSITYCNDIECQNFKIATTGSNLLDVISRSQYHFGYIEKI